MADSIKCKFVCVSVTPTTANNKPCAAISLQVSYDAKDSEENAKYFEATPSGSLTLSVLNEEAAKAFEPGKYYYLTLTPAN